MAEKKLEDAISRAAEIASKVPKNLQEAAFNRALEQLLGSTQRTPNASPPKRRRTRGSGRTDAPKAQKESALIDEIDRTKYPDIGATPRVADQAMKVLQLAQDDHGIDGLTATQIAEILTTKFRLPATRQGVGQGLSGETRRVNVRTGEDGRRRFHLMAPGEQYLAQLRSGHSQEASGTRKRRTKARRTGSKAKSEKATTNKPARKAAIKTAKKAASGKPESRVGPKAALSQLVQAGYFDRKRKIGEIQQELQHQRGRRFSVQELSSALVRCIRDETLRRARDQSGQYEYRKA